MAPIMPHLAEEIHDALDVHHDLPSVFTIPWEPLVRLHHCVDNHPALMIALE